MIWNSSIYSSMAASTLFLSIITGCQTTTLSGEKLTRESLVLGHGINFKSNQNVTTENSIKSRKINIDMPNSIGNGNTVPVTITSSIPNTNNISLVSNKHQTTIASFSFSPEAMGYVSTRFRVGASGLFYAFSDTNNGNYYNTKVFNVSKSGQSNVNECPTDADLKSKYTKGGTTLRILIKHCMNDSQYIAKLKVFRQGSVIASAELSPAVSRNPFFSFRIHGDNSGPYKVVWSDNLGMSHEKIF